MANPDVVFKQKQFDINDGDGADGVVVFDNVAQKIYASGVEYGGDSLDWEYHEPPATHLVSGVMTFSDTVDSVKRQYFHDVISTAWAPSNTISLNIFAINPFEHYGLIKNDTSRNVTITLAIPRYENSYVTTTIAPLSITVDAGKYIELSYLFPKGNADLCVITCSEQLG